MHLIELSDVTCDIWRRVTLAGQRATRLIQPYRHGLFLHPLPDLVGVLDGKTPLGQVNVEILNHRRTMYAAKWQSPVERSVCDPGGRAGTGARPGTACAPQVCLPERD